MTSIYISEIKITFRESTCPIISYENWFFRAWRQNGRSSEVHSELELSLSLSSLGISSGAHNGLVKGCTLHVFIVMFFFLIFFIYPTSLRDGRYFTEEPMKFKCWICEIFTISYIYCILIPFQCHNFFIIVRIISLVPSEVDINSYLYYRAFFYAFISNDITIL